MAGCMPDSEWDDDGELLCDCDDSEAEAEDLFSAAKSEAPKLMARSIASSGAAPTKKGTANAARVSRGSLHDKWDGLSIRSPKRDATQHVTVTVVIYNTVAGGVPGEEDVKAAIDDMEALYQACGWTGALASDGAAFMKKELTVKDALDVATKVATQPYQPESVAPVGGNIFPTSSSQMTA